MKLNSREREEAIFSNGRARKKIDFFLNKKKFYDDYD